MNSHQSTNKLKPGLLALFLLAGTLVRGLFGYFTHPWYASPDQLAWGLGLDEMVSSGHWRYLQLIHAPHEGGTFLIGLLSLLLRPFQSLMPSLSIAALLVDTLSRWIQILVVTKLAGRAAATWFGAWTVLAVPLLIPWATVDFGLHALGAFFPFVFLWMADRYKPLPKAAVILGVFVGLALSFSYDNVILVPAGVIVVLQGTESWKCKSTKLLMFLGAMAVTLIPHIYTRLGFHTDYFLEKKILLAGRSGLHAELFSAGHFAMLRNIWFTSLPGAFMLCSIDALTPLAITVIVSFFLFAGGLSFILVRSIPSKTRILLLFLIFLFVSLYAFSGFAGASFSNRSFVYYRHLAYIIPLMVFGTVAGLATGNLFKKSLLGAWLMFCGIAAVSYMRQPSAVPQPAYSAAGWILVKKHGDDVNTVFRIQAVTPAGYRDMVALGIGWGYAASLLSNRAGQNPVQELVKVVGKTPLMYRSKMVEGIHYAFHPGITPVLDSSLLRSFDSTLSRNAIQDIGRRK